MSNQVVVEKKEVEKEVNADVFFGVLTGIHGEQITFERKDLEGNWITEEYPSVKSTREMLRYLDNECKFIVIGGTITDMYPAME